MLNKFKKSFESVTDSLIKTVGKSGIESQKKKSSSDWAGSLLDSARVDAPKFNAKVPYQTYDTQNQVYINSNGLGIAKELQSVLAGANEKLITDLASILQNKFPTGNKWFYQFVLTGDHKIFDIINNNALAHSMRSEGAADRAFLNRDFYEMCALDGFPNKTREHYDLKNYRSFFFAHTTDKISPAEFNEKYQDIESSLFQTQIPLKNMEPQELCSYVANIVNHDIRDTKPTKVPYNDKDYISMQCTKTFNTRLHVDEKHIDIEYDGKEQRVICMSLNKLPKEFGLYQIPELLASFQGSSKSLKCPFHLSINFKIEDLEKSKGSVSSKLSSLGKIANSKMAEWLPLIRDEYQALNEANLGLNREDYKLANMYFDLILISDKDNYKSHVAAAEACFGSLEMKVVEKLQSQAFLANLPFMASDFFYDIQVAARVHRVTTGNIANMLPIVAEWTGSGEKQGMVLSGSKNQIVAFDNFNMGTESFDAIIVGVKGTGKSVAFQTMCNSVLDRGGLVYLMDRGRSHALFAKTNDGVYMDAKTIRLNLFANLDIEVLQKKEPENWRSTFSASISLIACVYYTMMYPEAQVDDYQMGVLSGAILTTYNKHGKKGNVDRVIEVLDKLGEDNKKKYGEYDRRITDMPQLLTKFSSSGMYGEIFNTTSDFDESKSLFCLEQKGFPDDIKNVVMLAMFTMLGNRIYMSVDKRHKVLGLEEFWAFAKTTSPYIQNAIVEGLRTFRKHQAGIIFVTQLISEFMDKDNKFMREVYELADIKLILRQNKKLDDETANIYGFNQFETNAIASFPASRDVGYSSILVKTTKLSSVCRLFLSPIDKISTTTYAPEVDYLNKLALDGVPLDECKIRGAWEFYPDDMKRLKDYTNKKYGVDNAEA